MGVSIRRRLATRASRLLLRPLAAAGLNIVRAQAGPVACLHQRPKRFVIQLTVPKD